MITTFRKISESSSIADERHQRQVDELPAAERDTVDGVQHQLVQAGGDRPGGSAPSV